MYSLELYLLYVSVNFIFYNSWIFSVCFGNYRERSFGLRDPFTFTLNFHKKSCNMCLCVTLKAIL